MGSRKKIAYLWAVAVSAMLAGCSGSAQIPAGEKSLLPQSRAVGTGHAPRYVYISDASGKFVDEFDGSTNLASGGGGRLVSRITSGMQSPGGLFVDPSHNLWVANGSNVLMFPEGATTPARTLKDPGSASDVTMGPDGTLYVANGGDTNGPGSIWVYPPGHDTPTRSLQDPQMLQNLFITVDPHGDLFVTAALSHLQWYIGRVDEYVGAKQSGLKRFRIKLGSPGGIIWRNGMVYVCDTTEHTVTELTEHGQWTGRRLITGGPWSGIDVSPQGWVLGADQQFIQGITRHFPQGKIGMTYTDPAIQMPNGAAFQTDEGAY